MNSKEIDNLVNRFIVKTAKGTVNPRIQQVTVRLLSDLFKTIEDLDLQQIEVWKGLEYLADTGIAQEMGLLAAGTGLERFMDIRADEAEIKAGLHGGTPRTIEGPLYVAGAPVCQAWARLDDGSEDNQGEVLFMQGTVWNEKGQPLPGASVEVWHANTLGNYSFFDKSQSAFNLRRTLITDRQGRYQFRSIVPSGYGCPPDGPVQYLLNQLGRHGRRPAHIHFFVTAAGYRKLTTQINIDGDEYLWDDFAFASREGLVPEVHKVNSPEQIASKNLSKPFTSIDFDFTLYQERAAVPDSVVERRHAQG